MSEKEEEEAEEEVDTANVLIVQIGVDDAMLAQKEKDEQTKREQLARADAAKVENARLDLEKSSLNSTAPPFVPMGGGSATGGSEFSQPMPPPPPAPAATPLLVKAKKTKLFSDTTFAFLQSDNGITVKDELVNAIPYLEDFKIKQTCTLIQEASLKKSLDGVSAIVQGQTGMGKTMAFTVAAFQKMDMARPVLQAVIVAPTGVLAQLHMDKAVKGIAENMRPSARELAANSSLTNSSRFKVFCLIAEGRGAPRTPIPSDMQLLVTSPGALTQHLDRRTISFANVSIFMVDEADFMMSNHKAEMRLMFSSLPQVPAQVPGATQVLFFSATYEHENFDEAKRLIMQIGSGGGGGGGGGGINAPTVIRVDTKDQILPEIFHGIIRVADRQLTGPSSAGGGRNTVDAKKKEILIGLLEVMKGIKLTIIFCDRKETVRDLKDFLAGHKSQQYRVCHVDGDVPKPIQLETVKNFQKGEYNVMVCTNLVARGIDIKSVNMVVNYEVPPLPRYADSEMPHRIYLHRIGRTGRIGMQGAAITLMDDNSCEQRLRMDIEGVFTRDRCEPFMHQVDPNSFIVPDAQGKPINVVLKEIADEAKIESVVDVDIPYAAASYQGGGGGAAVGR